MALVVNAWVVVAAAAGEIGESWGAANGKEERIGVENRQRGEAETWKLAKGIVLKNVC